MKFKIALCLCFTFLLNNLYLFACDPADAESIDILAINNLGTDYVVICNSSSSPVGLTGMIMIVDSNPNNVETLGETIVPAESCIRLVREVDFNFNLEDDDSFTISCDGTVFATAVSVGRGLTVFGTAPQTCSASNASVVSITGIVTGTGVDRAIICNSSSSDVILSGTTIMTSNETSEIPFLIIAANECIPLLDNLDFFLGLDEGSPDSFTISCGDSVIDSQSWTPNDLGPNGEISFGQIPCDPDLTAGSIFISSIVVDSSLVDQVVVCNSSSEVVSLDGADVVDSGNDGTNPQLELLVGLSIQPFSCITLINEIDFTFGLSRDDAFSISCMGNVIVSVEWEEDMLNSTGAFLFLQDPPVAPTNSIPTLGEWALFSLCLLLLIFGIVRIRGDELGRIASAP